jgi:uncharacterized cupredoxin-like copper-binding protein
MKKYQVTILVLIVLLASLALAACGPKKTTLNVVTTDFKFEPMTFEVSAGGEVTINLKNDGTLIHEFVIMKKGTEASIPFDENDEGNVFWEIEADPGKSVTGVFTAPTEPGEYEVVCGTAGHLEAGMKGTLTVK